MTSGSEREHKQSAKKLTCLWGHAVTLLMGALQAEASPVLHGQVKREWEIGRCIHNIYEPEKALPGYMGTGEGVVTENGDFVGAPQT